MSIYQELILDHYRNPHNMGKIDNATTQRLNNPSCGDDITLSVSIKDGVVDDIKFEGEGCAIAIASASILTDKVKGKTIEELRNIDKSFILDELGIELSPNRMKCSLLSLEVLSNLIKELRN